MSDDQGYVMECLRNWHSNPTKSNRTTLYNAATKLFGNPPEFCRCPGITHVDWLGYDHYVCNECGLRVNVVEESE